MTGRDSTLPDEADLERMAADFRQATDMARDFASTITDALEQAITSGEKFGNVMRAMALELSGIAVSAATKPLEKALTGVFTDLFTGPIKANALGSIVNGATGFANPLGGLGVLGEAGPEAIVPLARGTDGRLGIRTVGSAPGATVTVNIQATDLPSFRAGRAQVEGAIARAVARGNRTL